MLRRGAGGISSSPLTWCTACALRKKDFFLDHFNAYNGNDNDNDSDNGNANGNENDNDNDNDHDNDNDNDNW